MLTLGTHAHTTIFASTASYFTAHYFAYMQEANLITADCSAKNALAMARNPGALKDFLIGQAPSALRYFEATGRSNHSEPIALETMPHATTGDNEITAEQLSFFTTLLEQGAAELKGLPASWAQIAALEVQHAYLAANTATEETSHYRSLAIAFGQAGMKRRALSLFYDEVLSSSDFRPSAPDQLETRLNRIGLMSRVGSDMARATLREKAADFFKEAVSAVMQIPDNALSEGIAARAIALKDILELLAKSELSDKDLRFLWYELKHLLATLPDGAMKSDLRVKLESLL